MNSTHTETQPKSAAGNGSAQTSFLTPLANIVESKDGYVLEAEMPGVSKDGLELAVENGLLTLQGRRNVAKLSGHEVYRESRPLDYRRSFELDPSIDTTKITAKIDQGVLRLLLPKSEAVKPRRIAVAD